MALNDDDNPWKQGRRNGPPDLDEIFGKLFRSLFGGRSNGSDSPGKFSGFRNKGAMAVAAVVAGLWLLSGFYIVEANERGVVVRFGEYNRTTMPGPGWRIPYPIESVEVVNVTGNRSVKKRTTMLTQDENIVELEFSVQYRLKNAEHYLFQVELPDVEGDRSCRISSTICEVLDSAIRSTVGKNEMDYILREGRSGIAQNTMVLMQEILDSYGTGIEILTVNLEDSQPPNAVQDAFQDATKAREDMERFKNEAEAYANEVLPKARGQAARMVEDANGYRAQVVAKAKGEAERFEQRLIEYRKAPEVTRERMYLQAMEEVLSRSSKVIVDVGGGGNLLLFPLDQVLKGAGSDTEDTKLPSLSDPLPIEIPDLPQGLDNRLRQGR